MIRNRSVRLAPRTAVTIILLPWVISGCSFAFVNRPPPGDGPLQPGQTCTTSRLWPILDGLGVLTWAGAVAAPADDLIWGTPESKALAVGAGIASGIGSYIGFKKTGECRRRMARTFEARLAMEAKRRRGAMAERPFVIVHDFQGKDLPDRLWSHWKPIDLSPARPIWWRARLQLPGTLEAAFADPLTYRTVSRQLARWPEWLTREVDAAH